MASNNEMVNSEKWDKLQSWGKVQESISQRLEAQENYDDGITLNHGPQLYHMLRHPSTIKSMTHFKSVTTEIFVSHYRLGIADVMCVWNVDNREIQANFTQQRFEIQNEVTSLLCVPQHRIYLGFCSDLELRIYTDASSKCTEKGSVKCATTILCMAYNQELDEVYLGGVGALECWKVTGTEHSATAHPVTGFTTDIGEKEWVIDIKVDNKNEQVLALTYHNVFVINYQSRKQTHNLQNSDEGSLKCCCFYNQSEFFITGGGDGSVKVWNAVVFTQVHVFYGHHDAITGLAVHKKDPLLFSSSLDGSVQIWRMDNFTKLMRFDVGDKIYHMKLIGNEQFFCQTKKEIQIYRLNQFYHLFAPVESTVHHLQLCQGLRRLGQANRIIASTEDGSVRLFSPLTGETLTLIYPMPLFQVLRSFAYHRNTEKLLTVLGDGQVMRFNCKTNPCKAEEVWRPYLPEEGVTQLVQVTLEYTMQNGESMTDVAVFGGLRNGQISLLDSETFEMISNIQAHSGDISCMEYTPEIDDNSFTVKETSKILLTGASDNSVKLWWIEVCPGNNRYIIELKVLLKVQCVTTPSHLCMFGNALCVAFHGNIEQGSLLMFRVEGLHPGQKRPVPQYTQLAQGQEEEHTKQVTALDKCPLLGLFASTSEDGFVKIWDHHNQLIREMSFGEPLYGMCFANNRGDLLVGFQKHVCSIPLASYLPQNYLEKIVLQDFKDDLRENPIPYNDKLQPWFDPQKLPKFSTALSQRLLEKNKQDQSVLVIEDLEVRKPTTGGDNSPQPQQEELEEEQGEVIAEQKNDTSCNWKDKVKEEEDEPEDLEFDVVENSQELMKSQESLKEIENKWHGHTERKLNVEQTMPNNLDELTPWERELLKRKCIIPADGYIPNSVVRKKLGYVRPATPPAGKNDIWTLKPVPKPDPRHMPYGWEADYDEEEEEGVVFEKLAAKFGFGEVDSDSDNKINIESDSDSDSTEAGSREVKLMPCNQKRVKQTTKRKKLSKKSAGDNEEEKKVSERPNHARSDRHLPLLVSGQDLKYQLSSGDIGGDDEDGRQSAVTVTGWKKMLRTSSTLSNTSSKRGSKLSRRSTPVTQFEIRPKKLFEFGKHDLDLGTPDSSRMRRKSGGSCSRERSKSFRLSHMVVDEHSTDVTYKDGDKSGKRGSLLGTADLESVKRLLKEDWFDDQNLQKETPSFDSVMQRLLAMLDSNDADLHRRICNYILEIHKNIGIPDMYLDRIINKLSTQLGCSSHAIKCINISTLKEIGVTRPDVVSSLLPRLIDSQADIRDLAAEALADLVGVHDKEDLLQLMKEMGIARTYNSKEDEEEALKALAMRLDVPYRSESFTDWINNWVNESSPDMYEDDLKSDDIARYWDKRVGPRLPESLCLTESSSRASNRLRELSIVSDTSTYYNDYKMMDLERNLTFDSDLSFDDTCLPSNVHHSSENINKSNVPLKCTTHNNKQIINIGVNHDASISNNLEPVAISEQQVRVEGQSEDQSSDVGFESMQTGVGTQSEARSVHKQTTISSLELSDSDRFSSQESAVKGQIERENKEKLDTHEKDYTEYEKTKESQMDTSLKENVDVENIKQENAVTLGVHAKKQPPTPGNGRVQRSIVMDETQHDTTVIRSLQEKSSLTQIFPKKKFSSLEELEEEDGFNPQNPEMYEYYKKRFRRDTRPRSGKLAYGGLKRLPGHRTEGGTEASGTRTEVEEGGDEISEDVQAAESETGDQTITKETVNDTVSTQDSGKEHEMSEVHSNKPSEHSKLVPSYRTHKHHKIGKHRSKLEWKKYPLSPVNSSSSILSHSEVSTPQDRLKDVNWQKFLTTPTAMERKRLEMVKKDFSLRKTKTHPAPAVFHYIATDLPMLPGEAGLRLLHTVRVGDKGSQLSFDGRHRVESIPGKLMVETKQEDTGKSNFGILQMQWTTEVPNYLSMKEHRTSSPLSDYSISQRSRSSEILSDGSSRVPVDRLPKLKVKANKHRRKDGKSKKVLVLPDIDTKTSRNSPDFQWDRPLPPPPVKDSRTNIALIRKEHEKYCKYYDLTKKKMQQYTSMKEKLAALPLPEVVIKNALQSSVPRKGCQESSALQKSLSKLSKEASILLPPVTLNQLIHIHNA